MLSKREKKDLHHYIKTAEANTTAEIHVAFYPHIPHNDTLHAAIEYFHRLKLHKHTHKANVLIYILEKDQRFAIVGDQGIHNKVSQNYWDNLAENLSQDFQQGNYFSGLKKCIDQLAVELQNYYPKP